MMTYEGLQVFVNPWVNKEHILKTDNEQIIMHPYTAGLLMLETTAYSYKSVFENLGVTDDAIDACIDSAIRILYQIIDNK